MFGKQNNLGLDIKVALDLESMNKSGLTIVFFINLPYLHV